MTRAIVVVLNWNGFKDTEKCLNSLLSQDYPDLSVVVIDNGSIDGSPKKLERFKANLSDDRLHIIYNEENLGFAGGVNTGIRYAIENDFDAVALFNNDAIADEKWLSSLVSELEAKPETAILTGLLLHEDGKTVDSTGEQYSIWGMPFPRSRNKSSANIPESGFVFGATGGASLYRTSLFRKVGLFDERFFAYYEDVDVSFRAQLAGQKVFFTNKAIAYHKQGASSSKIPGFTVYQTFKNIPLLFIKNVPWGLLLPIGCRLFVLYVLIFGNAIKNGAGVPALRGWLASIGHFWSASLWQRFKIQRRKAVSTRYISSIIYPDLPPDQTGMRKLLHRKDTGQ